MVQRTNIYAVQVTVGTDIQVRQTAYACAQGVGTNQLMCSTLAHAQVFENEADKAQVHLNPLMYYKPNLFVSSPGCAAQRPALTVRGTRLRPRIASWAATSG